MPPEQSLNKKTGKITAVVIVLAAVLISALLLLYQKGYLNLKIFTKPTPSVSPAINKANFDPKLPQPFFLFDLPIEKSARVIESSLILNGLNIESVRSYESENTLAKDFADYADYFKKYYWRISLQNQQQYLAVLKVTKPSRKMTYEITITGGSEAAKQVIVRVSLKMPVTEEDRAKLSEMIKTQRRLQNK